MTDTLTAARTAIREAADSELPPFQRVALLGEVKRELEEALSDVDEAIEEAEAARQEDSIEVGLAVLKLRSMATSTEAMLTSGEMTEAEAQDAGLLTHADLDAMEEAGLMEAAANEMMEAGALVPDGMGALAAENE